MQAISCVAESCSSTEPAIAEAISLLSLIVAEIPLMELTASLDEFWIGETWALIWSVVFAVCSAFETSAEVEAMCARLATYRMTPLERSHLLKLHDASKAMVEAGDYDAHDAFNFEFHDCIYRATHNDFLAEQAIAVRTRLTAFRRTQLRHDDHIVRSRDEHAGVMEAISRGDGEEAARRMRAHMLNAASALNRYFAAHTSTG